MYIYIYIYIYIYTYIYIYICLSLCDMWATWCIMPYAVHSSIPKVQSGRAHQLHTIKTFWWKVHNVVTTGCSWKCRPHPDTVQSTANLSYRSAPHSWADRTLECRMLLSCVRFRAENLYNYWRLLFLIFVSALDNRILIYLFDICCLCI